MRIGKVLRILGHIMEVVDGIEKRKINIACCWRQKFSSTKKAWEIFERKDQQKKIGGGVHLSGLTD